MKKLSVWIFVLYTTFAATSKLCSQTSFSQVGQSQIRSADMESYVSFLASPLLKGRMNGEEGLEIAALYLESQAKIIGLKPANGNSFFQSYSVLKKSMDPDRTRIQVISGRKDTVTIKEPFYQLIPIEPTDMTIEGEVVFAGYGIKSEKYDYNDFENLKTEGKILLFMDKSPTSADGNEYLFEGQNWDSPFNFQTKVAALAFSKASAIIIVPGPKSGFRSFDDANPGLAGYLRSKIRLKGDTDENMNPFEALMPKVIFASRPVADALLKGSGHTLDELQKNIDESLHPHSFSIANKTIRITELCRNEEKLLRNVTAMVEGSDPLLKNEIVVYTSHYDHIGSSGNHINPGADDDASGCAALLSIAKAFQSLDRKPLRSILFMWVSGEEIGLFGSKSYINHPLFPLEKTLANLNMDMIGRIKGVADSTPETLMTGANSVFVITDNQSDDLKEIADKADSVSPLEFDYTLSGRNHPLQLFSRSDHFNFVEKNIPVLFFTSGLHSDYHTPGDVIEKINFGKMEMVARSMFEIGLAIANRKTRINVNNPYSTWGKNK
jgi:hypothetical protein